MFRAGSIIRRGIRYSCRLSEGLGRPDPQVWASHSASVGYHNSAATDCQATGAGWGTGARSSLWQPCQSGWHQGHFQANALTLDSFEQLCLSLHSMIGSLDQWDPVSIHSMFLLRACHVAVHRGNVGLNKLQIWIWNVKHQCELRCVVKTMSPWIAACLALFTTLSLQCCDMTVCD